MSALSGFLYVFGFRAMLEDDMKLKSTSLTKNKLLSTIKDF